VLVNEAGKGVVLCVLLWCRNEKVVEGEEKMKKREKQTIVKCSLLFFCLPKDSLLFFSVFRKANCFFQGEKETINNKDEVQGQFLIDCCCFLERIGMKCLNSLSKTTSISTRPRKNLTSKIEHT